MTNWVLRRLASLAEPWTNVYGVARSILAFGGVIALAFTPSDLLFAPAAGVDRSSVCSGARTVAVFCLAPADRLEATKWICIAVLAVVVSGFRPRLTGVLHWWVAFSISSTVTLTDGGDQVAAILTLLLVPLTLTDPRRWHWSYVGPRCERQRSLTGWLPHVIGAWSLLLIAVQASLVYGDAFIGKLGVNQWRDATALYYWTRQSTFGSPGWVRPILHALTLNAAGVTVMTWGALVLELVLALGIFADGRACRTWLLRTGIAFHLTIAVLIGLPSFGCSMVALLILYFRRPDETFRGWVRQRETVGEMSRKPMVIAST